MRDHLARMQPYSPGKPIDEVKRELGLETVVKLASNENPFGPSPKAIEAVRLAAENMHLYPDASGFEVKRALCDKFRCKQENLLLGNGSDELIHLLEMAFLGGPEDEIVVGDPSFIRYDAGAQLTGANLVKVPLDTNYAHDLPAMVRACTEKTRLVFVANPNNPTGTLVREPEIRALVADLPEGAFLVLDEAYYEFAEGEPGYPSSLALLMDGLPVIGLRTFSKTYGLAGIRLGYGFAAAEVVDIVDRIREPFNVNSLAQAAAIAALEDTAHLAQTVASNRAGLDRLSSALLELGATPVASFANFVFADLGRPARPVFEALLRRGVIVRSGEVFGTPTCVRISVGTPDEMETCVAALRAVLG